MSNTDNSPNDKEQEATVPADCRALLVMTRPLVVVKETPLSSREEKTRGSTFRASAEQGNPSAELALRRGEIVRRPKFKPSTTGDEKPTAGKEAIAKKSGSGAEDGAARSGADLPETDSDLQLRIYLGMS